MTCLPDPGSLLIHSVAVCLFIPPLSQNRQPVMETGPEQNMQWALGVKIRQGNNRKSNWKENRTVVQGN